MKKALTSLVILMLLVLSITNSMPFVQATIYDITINVDVSSPIQDETYFTNDIPLSFSYDSNITNSIDVANYTVVLCYNLDGQYWHDVYGNIMFSGETIRIGQFYQPVPSWWSASIHVPNGTHSLTVLVTFWVRPVGEYQNLFKVHNVSQTVNFTVYPETPNPTPQPEPFSATLVFASVSIVATVCIGLFVYFKKHESEAKPS
jgi:hypothetical protein